MTTSNYEKKDGQISEQYGGFSIRGLAALTEKIAKNPSILGNDWRKLLTNNFELTKQQLDLLDSCPKEKNEQIQLHFNDALEKSKLGHDIALRVVYQDSTTRGLYLIIGGLRGSILAPVSGIKVVCCDANCRDWHWCWGW